MRRTVCIAFLCCTIPSASTAQTQRLTSSSTEETSLARELTRIARERILLFDKGDTALWSPYVADGYVIATPSGALQTKQQVMQGFRPPLAGYRDVFSFEDVHVRRDGDVAVMSYVIDEYEFWDAQRYNIPKLRKTDTYILRDGRWLIVASQEGFIPAVPKAVKLDPAIYDAYVGRYQLMRSLTYAVTRNADTLMMQEIGQPGKRALIPESETTFFSTGESGRIVFVKGPNGRVTHLIIRDNNYDIRVRKLQAAR